MGTVHDKISGMAASQVSLFFLDIFYVFFYKSFITEEK